jgi:predicted PurR-regulated permease PerM
MNRERFSRIFLVLLLVAISAAFVAMIRSFLLTILLAAIFSALAHPLYERLHRAFRGRRALASLTTLALLILVVGLPLLAVLGMVASEALHVSQAVRPWLQEQLAEPSRLLEHLQRIPGIERLEPYREEILTKAGEFVGSAGNFLFNSLSATTRGTLTFFFQLFILIYAMFFFLMDGKALLRKILYYLPLEDEDERRILGKFTSVTRATLRGTLLIGVAQGVLAGIAFAVVGIGGAFFWGTLMTLLSIIPGIGTGLVWVPAAIVLLFTGRVAEGIGLALFCAFVVGSVDNFLRPRLVGRDTAMHDLLIFLATLGGILLFGVLGFIIGPVLAALFVTIWEIYGIVFREMLPEVGWLSPHSESGGKSDSEPDGGEPGGGASGSAP